VELSPDNALVAGGSDALYDKDVFVYRSNGTRVASVELWSNLIAGGLAWSPDSQRLYAVTAKPGSNPPVPAKLHILHV
jgi:sugar lactone lactonase YvrE